MGKIQRENQSLEARSESMDNNEMLLEILSRLPVKSLLRFMSVCKHWKTLISSRHFRKVHREKNTSSFPLLIASYNDISKRVQDQDIEIPEIPSLDPDPELGLSTRTHIITYNLEGNIVEQFDPPFPPKFFSMTRPPYQSKLLCFYRESLPTEFYLYNPSTRQSFLMPNPYPFSSSNQHCSKSPPELQIHLRVELGYIPSKDEYIMVHLVKSKGKILCEVLYISISEDNFKLHYNQWRTIESKDFVVGCIFSRNQSGVFIDGVFYWQAINYPENRHILSFDLEKKQFSSLSYPQYPSLNVALLELHGKLYVANFPYGPTYLVLWKLCSDNKSWVVHWKFDFERLFGFESSSPPIWKGFRSEVFIYYLKYLKGYEEQPRDEQVSAEMGKLTLPDGLDIMTWIDVAVHTNLFTL